MKRNYLQIFAVTLAFASGALATGLVLAIPAVERALGLTAWAQHGYEGGLAYLLIALHGHFTLAHMVAIQFAYGLRQLCNLFLCGDKRRQPHLLIAACSGLVVDVLRFAAQPGQGQTSTR